MNVRRYRPDDFSQLQQWGERYHITYSEENLPTIGFIVPGIAAYFLYETKTKVVFLENMIANSDAPKAERSEALKLIVERILSEAKRMGYHVAYACTDIPSVIQRAVASGATFKTKYVLLQKDLTK